MKTGSRKVTGMYPKGLPRHAQKSRSIRSRLIEVKAIHGVFANDRKRSRVPMEWTVHDYEREIYTKLRDGTPVMIRQVRPQDKKYLEFGMEQLSLESRHFRFFNAKRNLSEKELEAFTEIDHHTHDAWGAFDVSKDGPIPIGIARYIRKPGDEKTAEFAITMIDSHQERGLGSLLLGIIAARACDHGIETFKSVELAENQPMFNLLKGLDAHRRHIEGAEVEVEVLLHKNAREYPDNTAGEVFRNADKLYHEACAQS